MAGQFSENSASARESRVPRRKVLGGLAAGTVGGLGLALGGKQRFADIALAGAPTQNGYLYVQQATGGSITPLPGQNGLYSLVLTDVSDRTIYFANIGGTDSGTGATGSFMLQFAGLFNGNPNSALVAHVLGGGEETLILTLQDAQILAQQPDSAAAGVLSFTLGYTVRLLDRTDSPGLQSQVTRRTTPPLPLTFASASLFIDAGGLMQLVAYGAED